MVYIHGGNFVHMSADSELFDAEELAYKGQVIVVTLDYRLGRQWPPIAYITDKWFLSIRTINYIPLYHYDGNCTVHVYTCKASHHF